MTEEASIDAYLEFKMICQFGLIVSCCFIGISFLMIIAKCMGERADGFLIVLQVLKSLGGIAIFIQYMMACKFAFSDLGLACDEYMSGAFLYWYSVLPIGVLAFLLSASTGCCFMKFCWNEDEK